MRFHVGNIQSRRAQVLLSSANPGVWRPAYRLSQPKFSFKLNSAPLSGWIAHDTPLCRFLFFGPETPRRSRVKSLPKALIIGWLCAASWATPLARADDPESRGNESRCSQSAGSGPAQQQNALADTPQT